MPPDGFGGEQPPEGFQQDQFPEGMPPEGFQNNGQDGQLPEGTQESTSSFTATITT